MPTPVRQQDNRSTMPRKPLSFFKGVGLFLPEGLRVMATVRPQEEKRTGFKDNLMTAIGGEFTTNAILPDWIGLGKGVSKGFGVVKNLHNVNND